jgi:hypothetical protein
MNDEDYLINIEKNQGIVKAILKRLNHEENQFFISKILMPSLLLIMSIIFGTMFTIWMQERSHLWKQNHDGGTKTRMNLQEQVVKLDYDIGTLKKDVGLWESTSGNIKIEPMFKPIEIKLTLIKGLARQLDSTYGWETNQLLQTIEDCRLELKSVKSCVVKNTKNRPIKDSRCTSLFKKNIKNCNHIIDEAFLVKEK